MFKYLSRSLRSFVAIFFFTISVHAAIPPAENLLPSDTLLVVTIPDCSTFRSNLHQSPHWLLWNDPAMKPFRDKFISNYQAQFATPLERDLGIKLSDFADLPQGQFTFAVTANGWNGTDENASPGVVLLLDAKDKSGLLKTNVAALQKKWRDDGKTIRTETVGGIPFSVATLERDDIPATLQKMFPQRPQPQELGKENKPPKPAELVVGQFESLLIAGNSIKAVEPIVRHLTGGAQPALKDNSIFAMDQLSQFRDKPSFYGWFNGKTYFQILSQIPQAEENPQAPSPLPRMPWQSILSASGLTAMKSVSFASRESREGSRLNVFISAPESSRAGIFKIFSIVPKEAGAPPFVPSDAIKFSRWRIDAQKSWTELKNTLDEISPMAGTYLDSAINFANSMAQAKNPDFDLRKNLIGNLGDDFISYEKAPDNSGIAPSLFLFSAQNPEQTILAIKTVTTLMNSQAASAEPREFMGRKIYSIPLPNRRAGAPARTTTIYCSTANGYIAMSANSAMIEDFLRSSQSKARPLRETTGFAEAAQQVGGTGTGIFGFENQRETWNAIFKFRKNSPSISTNLPFGAANLPLVNLQNGIRGWMDFSQLPEFDKVSKYFYISASSATMTRDGYNFKIFTPRPPGLN